MSETQTIKMGEQYRTLDGSSVEIYCIDAPGKYPVHGRVSRGDESYVCSWHANGRRSYDPSVKCPEDLVHVPKTQAFERSVFLVALKNGDSYWSDHAPRWTNKIFAVHLCRFAGKLTQGDGYELCKRGDS